jgi:hypothetical protein
VPHLHPLPAFTLAMLAWGVAGEALREITGLLDQVRVA